MKQSYSSVKKRVGDLLHPRLLADGVIRYRARMLLVLSYGFVVLFSFLILFLLVFSPSLNSKLIVLGLWVVQFLGCSIVIYLLQVKGIFIWAVRAMLLTIFVITFSGIWITGGPVISTVTEYTLLLPIIAFYLLGIARGMIWTVAISIGLLVSFFMAAKGYDFINIFSPGLDKYFSNFIFLLGFIAIFLVILVYENTFLSLQAQHENSNKKMSYLASHDQLTGIANRTHFYQVLDHSIVKHANSAGASQLALLYMDLVGFKEINDVYGHHTGDIVLQKVAKNLEDGVRGTDFVARHGGDEFIILLKNVKDQQAIVGIANKISEIVQSPIDVVGTQVQVFPSMGIALFPKHAQDAQTLEHYADAAMYEAKSRKRDWKIYEGEYSAEERNY